jgi:hypothetical protein
VKEFYRKQLEEFVSPSDIPLFDVIISNLDSICIVADIFSDRNTTESTSSLILAIIKSTIDALTGLNIDLKKLNELLIESENKQND